MPSLPMGLTANHMVIARTLCLAAMEQMWSSRLRLEQALADVATIGILQERAIHRGELLNEQLQLALNSRVTIEQAKGVLAQYGGLELAAAFDELRRHARSHNVKLADLARRGLGPR